MKRVHLCGINAAEEIYRRTAPTIPFEGFGCQFDCEGDGNGWLVFAGPVSSAFTTRIPHNRRLLVVGEPAAMSAWSINYVNQFGILLSPYPIQGFTGHWVESHPGLPWFYGWNRRTGKVMSNEELRSRPRQEKSAELSVVLSNKVIHSGHRARLRFVNCLRETLGDRLSIFGRGIRNVDDKADAIDPYKYHLVLENSCERNYWSEKLADAYLGYSFPIYAGCPNVQDWFAPQSLYPINIENPFRAATIVREVLDSQLFEDRQEQILQTRSKVLGELSFPGCIAAALSQFGDEDAMLQHPETIQPPRPLAFGSRIKREAARIYYKLNTKIFKAA